MTRSTKITANANNFSVTISIKTSSDTSHTNLLRAEVNTKHDQIVDATFDHLLNHYAHAQDIKIV